MKVKIHYVKEASPKNKVTEKIIFCKSAKEAFEIAQKNMGENFLACVYYGKNFKYMQIVYPSKIILGFYCSDGSFSVISNNGKQYEFYTYGEAEEAIKKLQPKYKHHLESTRM